MTSPQVKTFLEKVKLLGAWLPLLLHETREDLERDFQHDTNFVLSYFPEYYQKEAALIPLARLVEGYSAALEQGPPEEAEELATALCQNWILAHEGLYDLIADKFVALGIDFEKELKPLTLEVSQQLIAEPILVYGALTVYLFAVLNSVMLSEEVLQKLEEEARQQWKEIAPNILPSKTHNAKSPDGVTNFSFAKADFPSSLWPLYGNSLRRAQTSSSLFDPFSSSKDPFESTENIRSFSPPPSIVSNSFSPPRASPPPSTQPSSAGSDDRRKIRLLRTSRGTSFILPRKDDDYHPYFKSQYVEGYLHKRSKNKEWKQRWVVLYHAKLYYWKDRSVSDRPGELTRAVEGSSSASSSSPSPSTSWCSESEDEFVFKEDDGSVSFRRPIHGCIPLSLVDSIRTAPKHGTCAFVVNSVTRPFIFRATTEEMCKRWLLGIHCSVAQIVQHVLSPLHLAARQRVIQTPKWWKKCTSVNITQESNQAMSSEWQPATLTETVKRHTGLRFSVAVAHTQGQRCSMEDEYCIVPDVNKDYGLASDSIPRAFFAVFDGHGGREAAAFAQQSLLNNIVKHPSFSGTQELVIEHKHKKDKEKMTCGECRVPRPLARSRSGNIKEAIRQGFKITDDNFTAFAVEKELYCGTTVVAALLEGDRLVMANLGDSRAVLCDGNGCARVLTRDHKPSRDDEQRRIKAAGGWIVNSKDLNLSQLYRINPALINLMQIPSRLVDMVGFITTSRVCGELSVSRAIGDVEYKGTLKNKYWGKEFSDDLIIAEPEIELTIHSPSDKFIILACDGLWDVLSNQEAVDIVLQYLLIHNSCEKAAEGLVREALKKGSLDNITVIIVYFGTENEPFSGMSHVVSPQKTRLPSSTVAINSSI
ncbi:PPM-type phosphatase domain-containing protein [Balamuthia mandrillaris]